MVWPDPERVAPIVWNDRRVRQRKGESDINFELRRAEYLLLFLATEYLDWIEKNTPWYASSPIENIWALEDFQAEIWRKTKLV